MSGERFEFSIEGPEGSSFSTNLSVGADGSAAGTLYRGNEDINWTFRKVKSDDERKDDPPDAEVV